MQRVSEHTSLLREHFAVLELEHDTCEQREKRKILKKEMDACRRRLEELEKETPLNRLVTRGGTRVYRVKDEDVTFFYLERMEFLCGWEETGEMFALKKSFEWRFLTEEEIQRGLAQQSIISPLWVGNPIRNEDGRLCNLLEQNKDGNYRVQIVVQNGRFMHDRLEDVVSAKSGGWSLVGTKD
ncbi:hypothetical protein MAR_ORF172 [Marseillevirus marseillevirus]|uniref:Uncharacterized protein n=1 Tax=Marseillevirus marseillevirus TaxID=694581 RepID=D2XAH6_GBMV|nr:hypothetical protein MAR_ORF172 [Marseillevirus marseillevirus]ADB03953.1 hypothetical protein MAR_ORF172 [Marseillevirus marseillevirus]